MARVRMGVKKERAGQTQPRPAGEADPRFFKPQKQNDYASISPTASAAGWPDLAKAFSSRLSRQSLYADRTGAISSGRRSPQLVAEPVGTHSAAPPVISPAESAAPCSAASAAILFAFLRWLPVLFGPARFPRRGLPRRRTPPGVRPRWCGPCLRRTLSWARWRARAASSCTHRSARRSSTS